MLVKLVIFMFIVVLFVIWRTNRKNERLGLSRARFFPWNVVSKVALVIFVFWVALATAVGVAFGIWRFFFGIGLRIGIPVVLILALIVWKTRRGRRRLEGVYQSEGDGSLVGQLTSARHRRLPDTTTPFSAGTLSSGDGAEQTAPGQRDGRHIRFPAQGRRC